MRVSVCICAVIAVFVISGILAPVDVESCKSNVAVNFGSKVQLAFM